MVICAVGWVGLFPAVLSRSVANASCGYILTTDQSDAVYAGIFSQRTNRTQCMRLFSHDGPIGCSDNEEKQRGGRVSQSEKGEKGDMRRTDSRSKVQTAAKTRVPQVGLGAAIQPSKKP
eukprot:478304-Pyramimonas_sp.AAC.1